MNDAPALTVACGRSADDRTIRGLAQVAEPTATIAVLKPVRLRNADAARYCGYAPKSFTNMRWRGEGPRFHRSGPSQNAPVFYVVSDLDEWMAERAGVTADELFDEPVADEL